MPGKLTLQQAFGPYKKSRRKYRKQIVRRFYKGGGGLDKATHRTLISKQSFMVSPFVSGGYGAASNYAIAFALVDIPDYASYQQLFDQYKIIKIDMFFEPGFTGNDTNGVAGVAHADTMSPFVNCQYRICKDYDDSTAYSTETDYFQNDTMISIPAYSGKTRKVTLYPRMKLDSGGLTDISVKPRWIDLDNVNVPHYGVKIYQPSTNGVNGYIEMKLRCTMYFACRCRQ